MRSALLPLCGVTLQIKQNVVLLAERS